MWKEIPMFVYALYHVLCNVPILLFADFRDSGSQETVEVSRPKYTLSCLNLCTASNTKMRINFPQCYVISGTYLCR